MSSVNVKIATYEGKYLSVSVLFGGECHDSTTESRELTTTCRHLMVSSKNCKLHTFTLTIASSGCSILKTIAECWFTVMFRMKSANLGTVISSTRISYEGGYQRTALWISDAETELMMCGNREDGKRGRKKIEHPGKDIPATNFPVGFFGGYQLRNQVHFHKRNFT